jgi:hypothetical protein
LRRRQRDRAERQLARFRAWWSGRADSSDPPHDPPVPATCRTIPITTGQGPSRSSGIVIRCPSTREDFLSGPNHRGRTGRRMKVKWTLDASPSVCESSSRAPVLTTS